LTKQKMKLNLNGVEIDLPNNAKIDVSQDGKSVKITMPEAEVIEKVRVVEVPTAERVIERIRVVEVDKYVPCTLPHYPNPYVTWTSPITGTTTVPATTTVGGSGIVYTTAGQVTCSGTSNISCNDSNLMTYDPSTGYVSMN
jgi:hypothetical protein